MDASKIGLIPAHTKSRNAMNRRHAGKLLYLSLLLGLSACRLPPEVVPSPPASEPTVLRAESATGGTLFNGAWELGLPFRSSGINDVARLFAGMEGSNASPFHQQQMQSLWRTHDLGRGQKIRSWAAREIGDLQRHRALFYPFSGPDYLFARELFPSAETYILCGLEPAEPLPDLQTLTPGEIAAGLDALRSALTTIMSAGYFITQDMRHDLQSSRFRGVLPVLLTFLVRTGAVVDSVDVVRIDGSGNAVLAGVSGGAAPGLMIRFHTGIGGMKRLFYFRQDLSNVSTRAGGPFLTFVAKQGYPPALVKSASYLMHDEGFSTIRNYVTNSTSGLVQDPSGVPYRHLMNAGLPLSLYGDYRGTIGIFSQQQPDLMAAYRNGQHLVQPVDFGFGYLYSASNTSLMVARRR
ncbi:MAG: hypothetical protein RL015_3603 [Verrucomicrobiota bacterium]|jgi:hypothetical protein